MAADKFIREPKEYTTEPSDDEVGGGMKRGGHAHKKHMALGGMPMAPRAMAPRPVMGRRAAAMGAPLLRKKGGKIAAEEHNEKAEIKRVERELKHHEHEKAGKAHHGLKKGGLAPKAGPDVMGGLAGGIEATRRDTKRGTGTIEGPGYKRGGHAHHAHGGKVHHISGHPVGSHEHHKAMAKHHAAKHKEGGSMHHHKQHEHHKAMAKHLKDGGAAIDAFETITTLKPKIDVNDKVHDGAKMPTKKAGTGNLEGVGYKRGGHAAKKHHFAKGGSASAAKFLADMHDGEKMPTKKAGTGDLEGVGYKKGGKAHHYAKGGHVKHEAHGGHVAHHEHKMHKAHGGHTAHHEHTAKHAQGHGHTSHHKVAHHAHGGKAHHTTKMSTTMKKGGKCNY